MTTGRGGKGVVGYNVQVAVDSEHHLIVAHEVTNVGHDQGFFSSQEILNCHQADITPTLPKPTTSGAKADGRFDRADLTYHAEANE